MASAWRIVRESRAKTAFTGEGPWRYGGRWNSRGVRMVYVSEHQSTAAFEIFIHRVPFVTEEKYKAFRVEWREKSNENFSLAKVPGEWRKSPRPPPTVGNGDTGGPGKRAGVFGGASGSRPG